MAHVVHTASAQLKAGLNKRVSGVKNKFENAVDSIESRAEKVGALRHSTLRGQLSFFSVPPEDREDPIPNTNVFLGVLYVLGAVAALSYAMIDTSCEPVTAYREDAPIDTCTEMLASFSCRTADYNRTAGTGFSKIFDKNTCLLAKNTTEEKFGHHPVAQCGSMKEGLFTCQTSDFDNTNVPRTRTAYENWDMIGIGFRKTFERDSCPKEAPHAALSAVYDAYPANTSELFSDTKFRCETADFVAGQGPEGSGGSGRAWVYDTAYLPNRAGVAEMPILDTYPAILCRNFVPDAYDEGNVEFTCQASDHDDAAGINHKWSFSTQARDCPEQEWDPHDERWEAGWVWNESTGVHSASSLLALLDDTSSMGYQQMHPFFKAGTTFTCQSADYSEIAGTGYKSECTRTTAIDTTGECPYREGEYLANGEVHRWYSKIDTVATVDWPLGDYLMGLDSYYNTLWHEIFTCQTADYNSTTGSGTNHTFMAGHNSTGVAYDYPDLVTCRGKMRIDYEVASCTGTLRYRLAQIETCTGTYWTPVEFDTCWGTREINVEFATCEGTQDVPVACTFISSSFSFRAALTIHIHASFPFPQMSCAPGS